MTDLRDRLPSDLVPHLPTAAGALTAGALTLVDPARLRPGGRFALRSASAALVGLGTWTMLKADADLGGDPVQRVALTAGAAGVMYGLAELGESLDAATQRGLHRLGVRRPRLVMALATVGVGLATAVADYRAARDSPDEAGEAEPMYRELQPAVRDLLSAILARTEEFDSLRLRAQLAGATQEVWGDEDESDRFVVLSTATDVPLAVPHSFTFPVSARFVSLRGVPCLVQLIVEGGRLQSVFIDVDSERWDSLADGWDSGGGDPDPLADVAWPSPSEVTFVAETSGRH